MSWGTRLYFKLCLIAMAPHPPYSTNRHSFVLLVVKTLHVSSFSFPTQWDLPLTVVWGWSHRHLIYRHPALVANFNRLKIYLSKICSYFHFLSQALRVQCLKFRLEISSANGLSLLSFLYSKFKKMIKIVIGEGIVIFRGTVQLFGVNPTRYS